MAGRDGVFSAVQLFDDDEAVTDKNTSGQDLPTVADDLQFHDYSDQELLLTSIDKNDIETKNINNKKKHEGTQLIGDDSSEDDGDRAELLAGEKKAPPFWTFEYYQSFFDVDTDQVLRRILYSMVPTYGKNYLLTKVRPNPDLYGPFWVCATLVFTIAISGNLASYFAHKGTGHWAYDFHKVTYAGCVVYSYSWLIPSALWGFFIWRGNRAGFTFLEIICVYGYSLSIFIPISILWAIPQDWLRWVLVVIGALLSGAVLITTFWRAMEDDDKKLAIITTIVIASLHMSLAIGFKLYFFKPPLHLPESTQTTLTTQVIPTS